MQQMLAATLLGCCQCQEPEGPSCRVISLKPQGHAGGTVGNQWAKPSALGSVCSGGWVGLAIENDMNKAPSRKQRLSGSECPRHMVRSRARSSSQVCLMPKCEATLCALTETPRSVLGEAVERAAFFPSDVEVHEESLGGKERGGNSDQSKWCFW